MITNSLLCNELSKRKQMWGCNMIFHETETEQYARWADSLNKWEWPDDLRGKPSDYDSLSNAGGYFDTLGQWVYVRCKFTVSRELIKRLEATATQKECLRWHWLKNLGQTNEAFERWWENWEVITLPGTRSGVSPVREN